MWKKQALIVGTFSILFLLIHVLLSWIATQTIPYLGFFSYPELLTQMQFPNMIKRLASFDGLHYIKISQSGYEQNAPAFFPFYPLLISILSQTLALHSFIAGLAISLISFVGIMFLFPRVMAGAGLNKNQSREALVYFLIFPTSFFLLTIYTESLFILLFLLSIMFIRKKMYILAAIAAFLAGTTRLIGLFTFVPLILSVLPDIDIKKPQQALRKVLQDVLKTPAKYIASFSSILGFLCYSIYLFFLTGDPLKFFHVQSEFGANRSTSLILFPQVVYRYIKIFITSQHNFQYFIAWIEFGVFVTVSLLLLFDLYRIWKAQKLHFFRLGLNIFSWINLLLPTLTGTFTSLPRYALVCFSVYIVLAELKHSWLKITIATIFIILHIILFMYFVQGYFVS